MNSERFPVPDAAPAEKRLPRRQEGDRFSKVGRHQHIISQLTAAPTLRASELAAALGVSGETIRRDLMELQEHGLINRTYGGASRPFALEPSLTDRRAIMIAEREAIASVVADLVLPNEVLMLGAGATTFHVARRLAARVQDITVITHDFAIAAALGTNSSIRTFSVHRPLQASTATKPTAPLSEQRESADGVSTTRTTKPAPSTARWRSGQPKR